MGFESLYAYIIPRRDCKIRNSYSYGGVSIVRSVMRRAVMLIGAIVLIVMVFAFPPQNYAPSETGSVSVSVISGSYTWDVPDTIYNLIEGR